MSAPAGLADSGLRIVLDLRHPFAYLALRPGIEFGRELAIGIDWLPLVGEALRAPSAPSPDDDRGILHRRHRAHMVAREIAVYAQAQGLTIRQPYRSDSWRAANLAWLWVRVKEPDSLPAFLEELFRRYWAPDLDADDLSSVSGVLRTQALHSSGFDAWAVDEGPRELERVARDLREAGVHMAPAYLVGGEVFHGRQHLPMIRWILNGRTGPPPI